MKTHYRIQFWSYKMDAWVSIDHKVFDFSEEAEDEMAKMQNQYRHVDFRMVAC